MKTDEKHKTNTVQFVDKIQLARLRRLLIESQLKPDEYLDKLIEGALGKLDDRQLKEVISGLATPQSAEVGTITVPVDHVEETFQRFNLAIRLQHGLMAVSIIILIFTGLPIKFHEAAISQWMMNLLGGIEISQFLHRIGATGLIFVGIIHLGYISLTRPGRRDFFLLLPRWKDLMDWIQMLKYYFHRTEEKAKFGRFSYIEKFDYWAVYWGMIIMISSGSILWFEETTMRFLPKYMMDIATEAHSDEALLATLAIVIWHFYNVHFTPAKFPMSKVFIHGKLTREEMEEEHPLELEEILAQRAQKPPKKLPVEKKS